MAPPAEWPVKSNEHVERAGFSSRSWRKRAATGFIIFRATDKKPEWHIFPTSSKKPVGGSGEVCKFTAQSMKV